MAVDARSAGRLVGMLIGPLGAASIQQKRSFLEGKVGTEIGSPVLDVRDDPFVVRGLGSRLYDGEGIAAKPFPVFEGGVVRNYYIDSYYGRKLGLPPTTARTSNLTWKLGSRSQAELLRGLGDGILVTGFLGGNSNGTTGDFSLGVRGFRIRGGRVAEPVGEMNVSGNHLELWRRLAAVGDDPVPILLDADADAGVRGRPVRRDVNGRSLREGSAGKPPPSPLHSVCRLRRA